MLLLLLLPHCHLEIAPPDSCFQGSFVCLEGNRKYFGRRKRNCNDFTFPHPTPSPSPHLPLTPHPFSISHASAHLECDPSSPAPSFCTPNISQLLQIHANQYMHGDKISTISNVFWSTPSAAHAGNFDESENWMCNCSDNLGHKVCTQTWLLRNDPTMLLLLCDSYIVVVIKSVPLVQECHA